MEPQELSMETAELACHRSPLATKLLDWSCPIVFVISVDSYSSPPFQLHDLDHCHDCIFARLTICVYDLYSRRWRFTVFVFLFSFSCCFVLLCHVHYFLLIGTIDLTFLPAFQFLHKLNRIITAQQRLPSCHPTSAMAPVTGAYLSRVTNIHTQKVAELSPCM